MNMGFETTKMHRISVGIQWNTSRPPKSFETKVWDVCAVVEPLKAGYTGYDQRSGGKWMDFELQSKARRKSHCLPTRHYKNRSSESSSPASPGWNNRVRIVMALKEDFCLAVGFLSID